MNTPRNWNVAENNEDMIQINAMQSGNPTLTNTTFSRFGFERAVGEEMTIQGVVFKTLILLLIALLAASWTWMTFSQGHTGLVTGAFWVGLIGGFALALVTTFKMAWSPVTAPLYAAFEGLFLGGISAGLEAAFPGIAVQTIGLTIATMFGMFAAYQTGIVQVTDKLKSTIILATFGIAIFYLISMILSLFGIGIPLVFGNGCVGIGFSVLVVGVAAFNLLIDFDFIANGIARRSPKYMEWYSGFALLVTLVWLYLEILRLLAKLRPR